jgi:hypothetical protein
MECVPRPVRAAFVSTELLVSPRTLRCSPSLEPMSHKPDSAAGSQSPLTSDHGAVTEFLKGRGYTPHEISKVLARLEKYDSQTEHDAVFDSIGRGSFTLDEIIRQALEDESAKA